MEKFVLSLQEATVRYIGASSERPAALDRVSIDIRAASWTALVGRNGSGKSTLSKTLSGVSPLSAGSRDVSPGVSVHMVLQHPETQLLGETVEEELALCAADGPEPADPDAARAHWKRLLQELGLAVPLDAPVKPLSGGQKQLLNVASCLVAGAACIVFDESTSMLDPASRQSVLRAAAAVHRSGRTVIWATHRMEEVVRAGRVIALERGQVAFDGTPERFFYGEEAALPAPCDRLGFEPPSVVRAARALRELGFPMEQGRRPLSPEALTKAVTSAWPST